MIGQANLPSVACRGHRPSPLARVLAVLAAVMLWASGSIIAKAQQVVGPPNAILCNLSAPFTGSGASAKLISGIASTHIHICGWAATESATSGSVNISTGTGTNCGTNNASLTGTLNIGLAPLVDHIPYAAIDTPNGNDLCVNGTTTTLTGIIWYSQF